MDEGGRTSLEGLGGGATSVGGLLGGSVGPGEVLVLPFGARISWLRRALTRLPERAGALPADVLAFTVGGVAFLPEDLETDEFFPAEAGVLFLAEAC